MFEKRTIAHKWLILLAIGRLELVRRVAYTVEGSRVSNPQEIRRASDLEAKSALKTMKLANLAASSTRIFDSGERRPPLPRPYRGLAHQRRLQI